MRTFHKYHFPVKPETTSRDTGAGACWCTSKGLTSVKSFYELANWPMLSLLRNTLSNSEALLGDWRDVRGRGIAVSDDVRQLDRRKLSINDHGERWMETSTSSWLHEKVPLFGQGHPEQQHRQVQLLPSYFLITLHLLTNTSVVKEAATPAFYSLRPVRKCVLTLVTFMVFYF